MQPDNKFSPQSTPPQDQAAQPPSEPSVTGTPAQPIQSYNTSKQSKNPFKGKKFGFLAAIVAGVLLLGGGAAAFFVYQEQNKPENVLKKAIDNAMQARSTSFDGEFKFSQDGTSAVVGMKGQSSLDQSAFQLEADVTVSGVSIPVELRSLDKSIYFKVSNLDPVVSMASGLAPEYAGIASQVADKIDNQWIEVDETLLSQGGASCMLNADLSLTAEDRELLFNAYDDNPFATIKSTSDDKVNDRAAIKYEIEIDNNKAGEYGKVFKDLSAFKKLKECNEDVDEAFETTTTEAEAENMTITLWVDKSAKEITKLATSINKDGAEGSFEMTFEYGEVEITKPEGAKPVMQVIGELSSLFNGTQMQGGGTPRALGDFIQL